MKTVEISDEAYDKVMKDAKGAPFDAMLWNLIRGYETCLSQSSDMMGMMLTAILSDDPHKARDNYHLWKQASERHYSRNKKDDT